LGMENKILATKYLRKYWYKFAKNLLTCSNLVNLFVGENFKKIKVNEFCWIFIEILGL